MKQLIIAEKPSLAKKIVDAIGHINRVGDYYENEKYVVVSVFGHLLTLYDLNEYLNKDSNKWELSDLNFFPEKFKWKVKNDKGIRQRYKLIKQLISRKDVNTIVNAGDADREGEVLINVVVYSILKQLKIKKNITRIWLEDQTEQTILNELSHQRNIEDTKSLYEEGLARTYIDWLYGIYLTRYISIKANATYPTGRVIIPTVKYVYDRYYEIKNFVPTKYYKINCLLKEFNNINIDFKDMKFELNEKYKADKLIQLLNNNPITVSSVEKNNVVKQPKRLFSLSTLQNYMNKKYKWSLDKTLEVLQSLYEDNYTTYPRTNTEYLATKERKKIEEIISILLNSPIIKSYNCNSVKLCARDKMFDDSKIESHSAITITTKIPNDISIFSDDKKLLYSVILNRCLANFCNDKCVIAETKISFKFVDDYNTYSTTMKGQNVIEKGYLFFENDLQEKELPNFFEGQKIYCNPVLEIKETTPPNNVTELEINKFFEKPFKKYYSDDDENTDDDYKKIFSGVEIGTVATRSATIEKIKKVGYITSKKNCLIITDKGIAFIEILKKLNVNLWADKTAMLSQDLKKVYQNKITKEELIESAKNEISEIISNNFNIETEINHSKEVIGLCPLCGKPIYENAKAFGCSGYKDGCKFVIWKHIAGKNISKTIAKELLNNDNHLSKKINGFKSKQGKDFSAKLLLDSNGKIKFVFDN